VAKFMLTYFMGNALRNKAVAAPSTWAMWLLDKYLLVSMLTRSTFLFPSIFFGTMLYGCHTQG
jgi:hypothetical protein